MSPACLASPCLAHPINRPPSRVCRSSECIHAHCTAHPAHAQAWSWAAAALACSAHSTVWLLEYCTGAVRRVPLQGGRGSRSGTGAWTHTCWRAPWKSGANTWAPLMSTLLLHTSASHLVCRLVVVQRRRQRTLLHRAHTCRSR